jgi:hypothetical protein
MGNSLDPESVTPRRGSMYPAPFGEPLAGREKRALGDPLGLTQFASTLQRFAPAPGRRSDIGMRTRTSLSMSLRGRSPSSPMSARRYCVQEWPPASQLAILTDII